MLPDLVSLSLFLRAVEARSLSKAAAQSHLALAAASRRIAQLEHCYGVQLLYRSAQGVEPTPAGNSLAFHARQLLHQEERLRAELSDFAKGIRGHIRIQANTSAITQFLPGDLAAFVAEFPDVKLELEESRSIRIAQALREGSTEIGIVLNGTDLQGLESFDYRADRLVAVVPRGHALRRRKARFAELIRHDLVGLDSGAAMMRLLADAAAELGEPLRLRVQVSSFEAVCKLVQAGMGIGVLPEGAARDFAAVIGLRQIHIEDAWAARQMLVAVRRLDALSPVGRKLVARLVAG
ncbi:MAG: LysR family transcriptional regulator [Rhodocyclales bacterium]|nr:LysR family transcriptional regulator [Rhodocyclales bacterium]